MKLLWEIFLDKRLVERNCKTMAKSKKTGITIVFFLMEDGMGGEVQEEKELSSLPRAILQTR